ncbi:MAG: STAS domain-containing protein [Syntrophales bacterium]|nr:STAS domain-containing protein [Syntrophales bacterium]
MKNKKKASPNHEVLKFAGDLTIDNAQELHRVLLAALDNATEISLTFAEVTAVDLSFVQLLCAAHRTAIRADKTLKLADPRPEVLKAAVRETGFIRERGCNLDSQGSCLWKEGWE